MTNSKSHSTFSCIVVVALTALLQTFSEVQAGDNFDWGMCRVEFADKADKIKIVTECATKQNFPLKLNMSIDGVKEQVKSIKDKDFDDGCFSKCLFEKTNMLESDGKVATAKLADFYKGSTISPELLKEIQTMFETCVKEAETNTRIERKFPASFTLILKYVSFRKLSRTKNNWKRFARNKFHFPKD